MDLTAIYWRYTDTAMCVLPYLDSVLFLLFNKQTPPQDLKSLLAIKFKRTLLLALATKEFLLENPVKREVLLEKYKKHIMPVEEAEWYGLTFAEAVEKMKASQTKESVITPKKIMFLEEFIEQLKEKKKAQQVEVAAPKKSSTWGTLFNPFSKKS